MTKEVILRARRSDVFAEHENSLRGHVFGALVQLATPVVKRYHSDLYHDATWLSGHLNGSMTFYYGASKNGTHIGMDRALIERHSEHVYSITLRSEVGTHTLTWCLSTEKIK